MRLSERICETIIIYRLPRLTREEIQAMLKIHDIRESRVYQEAKAEGIEEERALRIRSIPKLAALNITPEQIAETLELDLDLVRRELAKTPS